MRKTLLLYFIANVFYLKTYSQNISLNKLLSLQQTSVLKIQDFIETNYWKFDKVVTLKQIDSGFYNFQIGRYIDSIRNKYNNAPSNVKQIYSYLTSINFEDPAWIKYQFEVKKTENTTFANSLIISLPKKYLFEAIYYDTERFDKHLFQKSIEFTFAEDSVYISFLKEIERLHVPDSSSSVKFHEPFVMKVYKLSNQVIELTTIKSDETYYSIKISSRYDYDYLYH
jgi:hypothetical protein